MVAVPPLSSGAIWRGSQTSGQTKYEVEVRICSVDKRGDVSGTLTIRNLTPTLPKVVTYFDGEIIGKHHSFVTDKWGATPEDDKRHWGRFRRDLGIKGGDSLDDDSVTDTDNVLFMRLKERCIIDAGRDADISGASFAGFYYIAIDLSPASKPGESGLTRPSSPNPYFPPCTPDKPPHSAFETHSDATISPSRPLSGPLLVRSESYAAVVRGRTLPVTMANAPSNLKNEEAVEVSVASVTSSLSIDCPFSPSLDEYPLPSSPPPYSSPFAYSASPRTASYRPANAKRGISLDRRVRATSSFYNGRTGYQGAWANASMRGFYFASSSDPYQELELDYVGDGMGAVLEEYAEGTGGIDEWGNVKPVDERSVLTKEMQRRARYSAPRGSASFKLL